VAFLVSRIEESEAVWSLFGGVEAAQHALEALLDDTMDHWRREGATRARKGLTGLLGGGPRLSEDAALVDLLKDRGFEIRSTSARMELDLGKRAPPEGLEEREAEMRRKGCFVRAARPEEVLIVARQYHPRHTGEHSQELWNLFVRHLRADALFIAEVRRQVVGYAAYLGWTLEAECPQLGPLHVDEAYRRGGIEGVLVHHAALAAREHGKACVGVHCGPDKVSFYQRAGFAVAARLCHEAVAKL
jgi:GNAT superfamily N-acetyltransferase